MLQSPSPSSLSSTAHVMETMTDEEKGRFGSTYSDLLEVCRHMEIRQEVGRQVIVEALLATVMTLCGSSESFAGAVEATKRREP